MRIVIFIVSAILGSLFSGFVNTKLVSILL